jgi:hypothetical protein
VWEFPASKAIPWAGTFTGPGEVGRFFPAVMECSEPQAFEPLHFVAADGCSRSRALSRQVDRLTWACEWAHAMTVRDGNIASFREYTDTAAIAGAFGKG